MILCILIFCFFYSKLEDKRKIKGPGAVSVHNPHTVWETPRELNTKTKNVL